MGLFFKSFKKFFNENLYLANPDFNGLSVVDDYLVDYVKKNIDVEKISASIPIKDLNKVEEFINKYDNKESKKFRRRVFNKFQEAVGNAFLKR